MDGRFNQYALDQWRRYFSSSELPITFFYTDHPGEHDIAASQVAERCLIGNLNRVRQGFPFVYDAHTPGCSGGKRYTGFTNTLSPNFEYFLSCGIPGELEGERYIRDPALVRQFLLQHPAYRAPARYLVFKRWDRLDPADEPQAVIFFASGDVLSGLFTLANYDVAEPGGVIAPMGSGCASIIAYPLEQATLENPRCVLGMFDISARPHVDRGELTFSIPNQRFIQMVNNMDESFLVTHSWDKVRSRLL